MKKRDYQYPNIKVCCLCGKPYMGYGNNAMPVKSGQCCDECNLKVVIPARLNALKDRK